MPRSSPHETDTPWDTHGGVRSRGLRRFTQCLLDPETPLHLALQVLIFSLVTGTVLGIVATQVPLYVAVFLSLILGSLTLPLAHRLVARNGSYYTGVLILLAAVIIATAIAMTCAWLVFDNDFGGADWHATFSAALFTNMVYVGLALEHKRARENKRRADENLMRLLQSQINPHFMSNTLANLSALIDSDPPAAQNLLRELVSFMSDLVYYARQDTITLADALDSLDAHLHIHRVRVGDRLSWDVDVPDELLWQPLLPLMILPLVENAMVHGINLVPGNGWIKFVAAENKPARQWHFSVINSGDRRVEKSPRGHGIAVANIQERLLMRYGAAARLELFWMDDHTHCARITLPLVENAGEQDARTSRLRPRTEPTHS